MTPIYLYFMPFTRKEVERIFRTSKEKGTAIGLRIKGRQSLVITVITNILGQFDDDTIILVNKHTIYGEKLQYNQIFLNDIECIFNLRVQYNDPFYVYLRGVRSNIRSIREEVGLETSSMH
jgi:hypothetical protein